MLVSSITEEPMEGSASARWQNYENSSALILGVDSKFRDTDESFEWFVTFAQSVNSHNNINNTLFLEHYFITNKKCILIHVWFK